MSWDYDGVCGNCGHGESAHIMRMRKGDDAEIVSGGTISTCDEGMCVCLRGNTR